MITSSLNKFKTVIVKRGSSALAREERLTKIEKSLADIKDQLSSNYRQPIDSQLNELI